MSTVVNWLCSDRRCSFKWLVGDVGDDDVTHEAPLDLRLRMQCLRAAQAVEGGERDATMTTIIIGHARGRGRG